MVVGSAPVVGQHTEHILKQTLGYSDAQIQELQTEEVVGVAGPAVAAD